MRSQWTRSPNIDVKGISPERVHILRSAPAKPKSRYVLYWMQQAQRVSCNHALEYAAAQANRLQLPLLVVFGLTSDYPDANWRHYTFMLEGLRDVQSRLKRRGVDFRVEIGSPDHVALKASRRAALLICDRGYLRHQRQWRHNISVLAPCPVIEVDSDVIVPAAAASGKAEYAARTLRPKIQRLLPRFLSPLRPISLRIKTTEISPPVDINTLMQQLTVDRTVPPVSAFFIGGHGRARKRLMFFLRHHFNRYDKDRNQLHLDASTMLSPYLHFGHISALEIALEVNQIDAPPSAKATLLEELVVRRELSVNFVIHTKTYDRYTGLPQWARTSLDQHKTDPRKPAYSFKSLVNAQTGDPYWNAAMLEAKVSGYMHNYMRMYWGKKVLQWSESPQTAYRNLLRLNNTYFLDGRDPNSYAGVGWIFGLHDRPWKERPIFGKVRYMARSGLERKFDVQGYLDKVNRRIALIDHA
jgi:deoxyribodipyrimidine photo-lyase